MNEIAWTSLCCAVDFSEESRAALRVAVDLCRRFGARLTLLHVNHGGDTETGRADGWRTEAAAAGVPTDSAEVVGDPKTAIAEWAERHGFDAIVMGTHGRTGRTHSLVGSVAESTVRLARCPVMVVHDQWKGLR